MHGKSIQRQHHSHECSVRLYMSAHNHMQQICSHLPTWQRDMKSRAMSEQEPWSGPGRGCHNAASSSEALASRRGSCCWAHHGHQPLLLLLQLPLACAPQYNILHAWITLIVHSPQHKVSSKGCISCPLPCCLSMPSQSLQPHVYAAGITASFSMSQACMFLCMLVRRCSFDSARG